MKETFMSSWICNLFCYLRFWNKLIVGMVLDQLSFMSKVWSDFLEITCENSHCALTSLDTVALKLRNCYSCWKDVRQRPVRAPLFVIMPSIWCGSFKTWEIHTRAFVSKHEASLSFWEKHNLFFNVRKLYYLQDHVLKIGLRL